MEARRLRRPCRHIPSGRSNERLPRCGQESFRIAMFFPWPRTCVPGEQVMTLQPPASRFVGQAVRKSTRDQHSGEHSLDNGTAHEWPG
jgi:hypothetical protein